MDHPSPAEIAKQILHATDRRRLRDVFRHVVAMTALDTVSDENGYEIVATVRRGLGGWRTSTARDVKRDLDTLLTHYRVDQWG